jgi:integrase
MAKRRGNNEGSIYQRKNGSWAAQVSVEGHRLSFTAKTRRECQEWIKKTINQVDNGMTYVNSRRNLEDYLQEWLTNEKLVMRSSTWSHYNQLTRSYVIPAIGKIILKDLRTEHIRGFYNQLISQKIGVSTIQKIHTLCHSSLELAVKIGAIPRNPTDNAHPPKPPHTEMMIFDDKQVNHFLVSIIGHRWEALYHLAIVTGMRQSELLGLKWIDLDWIRQTIKVERQLARADKTGVKFLSPKTRAGRRTVALGDRTIDVMRSHYECQQSERLATGDKWVEHGLIFTNSFGGPIHHRNLLRDFYRQLKSAGLPRIRFHDLRHTAASLMLNNGVPALVLSRRLGHSKASITLDVYGHLIPAMQAEAAELIDELITPIQLQPTAADFRKSNDK